MSSTVNNLNQSGSNVDSGYAWVIPFACCFINAILFGIHRSYSLFLSEVLETYHVSRSDATWPFSLCMTVIHLSGPISGVLNSHLAIRTIVFIGCIFSTIGVALCYFATSVLDIVIFVGIIQGFGIGITYVQNPAIINEYFVKYRGSALGIALSGGTLGTFAISPLAQKSLEYLGLHKSFLTLAVLTLLTLPISLTLRPRISASSSSSSSTKESSTVSDKKDNLKKIFSISPVYLTRFGDKYVINNDVNQTTNSKPKSINSLTEKQLTANYNPDQDRSTLQLMSYKFVQMALTMERKISVSEGVVLPTIRKLSETAKRSQVKRQLVRIVSILTNPYFALICSTHLAYFWGVITYTMVNVDLAVDKGITRNYAVHLITTFSAGDLVGRLGSGWFMDNRLVPLKYLAMFNIFTIGVLLKCIPLTSSYHILATISTALGFISGIIVNMLNILFCKYLGTENSPLAFGLSSFFCGLTTLVRPMLVGYYRDAAYGSYDGLFNLLSVLGFLASALWLTEPFINRSKLNKHNQNETVNDYNPSTMTTSSATITLTPSSDKLKQPQTV
ncbi:monocarboxylate transporter 13 [Tetranychus urticae]|uniref:Major facilitator superfamily (MFS) profile domain-containing protein n=1 Tax=Tetranychus urticae TaxID=32264 RepID=T1KH96_TETUR|nr:monocarboxylate transporter 13 [Tetranychus urticae]XP_015786899.1 monocarboxylate transporter 13 [Tetranychus urticae]XP_015786900.1 monocarboxylate transporter 13 [Tetranychus urticae]XP_015786901.1 monocarboxylate transporter 13 [Tetranychus urticae]XP_025016950.1 monocarboxylate transporter 13 [Tetranychus urticae]XP_025016951.1 monocarboxylate transporter 13 [Tetranychus urticae]XP_025016952.1 monocarboxylate transporter 13 [Tetranychus urticae]XP_025016953.1 monocarboxylate transpor